MARLSTNTSARTEEAVTSRRALAEAAPEAYLPNLAASLNNLSTTLADVGRREQALAPIEEAVTIRRALAEQHRDVFAADLARSLAAAGSLTAGGGHTGKAVAYLREATVLANELNDETTLSLAITTLQQEQQTAQAFAVAWRELTGEEAPDWSVGDSSTSDPSN